MLSGNAKESRSPLTHSGDKKSKAPTNNSYPTQENVSDDENLS